jgi:hypothetical protein
MSPGSTHQYSPTEALRLAESLGWGVESVIIFGVEIAEPGPLPGLTAPIQAAVPSVATTVLAAMECPEASACQGTADA